VRREHLEVFCEHAPDALENEVAQRLDFLRIAIEQRREDARHFAGSLLSEFRLATGEDGLSPGEEHERIQLIW
jgi:hypothetical protein